jgi:CPA1 family monovalent cation:H+ antiporter
MGRMDLLLLAVAGVLVIVTVTSVAGRIGVAAPLLLVLAGVGISFLPGVPAFEVPPEAILAGVLPPLLYAASVNMPALDFRRDFKAISGLSVVLVLVSALALGWLLPLVVPGIGFAEAFALGAIVSPTDAVATSIVRRTGVAPRLVTVLDGESMLNDATALVLLRTAVASTGASASLWHVGLDFVQAVLVAVVVGLVVAAISLFVRSLVEDATVATSISFVVPFLAYAPAEHLGGSGLVAVVVAGLATGTRGLVELRAEDRIAEEVNWRTIAFLLEGAVFLVMGLELRPLLADFDASGQSWSLLVLVTAIALGVLLVGRALWVALLLLELRRGRKAARRHRPRLATFREYLASDDAQRLSERRRERALQAVARREADLVFYEEQRLGRRDGIVLVWAGMRGVITLAAAQTLPPETAQRSLLVLAAFCVAGASLLVQGGTLAWVVRRLGAESDRTEQRRAQVRALLDALGEVADARCTEAAQEGLDGRHLDPEAVEQVRRRRTPAAEWAWAGEDGPERERRLRDFALLRRAVLEDQREALLDLRSEGRYDSRVLDTVLGRLDVVETSARGRPPT